MTQRFVECARALVGTKFRHEGRLPGVGIDCIGVAVCAAMARGLKCRDVKAYPLRPNGQLLRELDAQLVRVRGSWQPADILVMQFNDGDPKHASNEDPHHIAVYTGPTIIHAYFQARKCVEQPITRHWRDLTKLVYRFREFA